MTSPYRYHFPNLLEAFFIVVVLYFAEYLMDALIWRFGREAGLERISIQSVGRVLACGLVFTVLLQHNKLTYRELVHENCSSWQATLAVFFGPILLLSPGLLLLGGLLQQLVVLLFPMSQSQIEGSHRFLTSGLGAVVLVCLIAPIVEEMLFSRRDFARVLAAVSARCRHCPFVRRFWNGASKRVSVHVGVSAGIASRKIV